MDHEASVLTAEPAGRRFSDWLEDAPIGRTAARELMKGLQLEPAKVRLPGVSAKVAWLRPEMEQELNAAVARLEAGESVAEIVAQEPPHGAITAPSRDQLQRVAMPSQETLLGLLAAMQQQAAPDPLARARAMRQAADDRLLLTAGELAELTGRDTAAIGRVRSGSRLLGYRVWKVAGGSADPEPVFLLTQAAGPILGPDRD
jgi:hypothetical protein